MLNTPQVRPAGATGARSGLYSRGSEAGIASAGGAFEFADVTPGDYYLVAFDHTERSGLPAADLPAVIVPMASSVRVEAGSTASVDLRVNQWPW